MVTNPSVLVSGSNIIVFIRLLDHHKSLSNIPFHVFQYGFIFQYKIYDYLSKIKLNTNNQGTIHYMYLLAFTLVNIYFWKAIQPIANRPYQSSGILYTILISNFNQPKLCSDRRGRDRR